MEVDPDHIIIRCTDFNPKWTDMFIIAAEDWQNACAAVRETMQELSRAGRRKEQRKYENKNRAPTPVISSRPQDFPRRLTMAPDPERVRRNLRKWFAHGGGSSIIRAREMTLHAAYANYFENYQPPVMREWAQEKRAIVEHRPKHLPPSERTKRRAEIEAKVQAATERRANGKRKQKAKKPIVSEFDEQVESEFDHQGMVPQPAPKKKAVKAPKPPASPPGISPHLWSLRDALEKVLKIDGKKTVVV